MRKLRTETIPSPESRIVYRVEAFTYVTYIIVFACFSILCQSTKVVQGPFSQCYTVLSCVR